MGAAVPHTLPLMQAGLDSLTSLELRGELSSALSIELSPTLVFDYPTVEAMSEHLVALLTPLPCAMASIATAAGDRHGKAQLDSGMLVWTGDI